MSRNRRFAKHVRHLAVQEASALPQAGIEEKQGKPKMAVFEFDVAETLTIRKRYVVEADTAAEATEKALIGDTYSEEELNLGDVSDRTLLSGAKPL